MATFWDLPIEIQESILHLAITSSLGTTFSVRPRHLGPILGESRCVIEDARIQPLANTNFNKVTFFCSKWHNSAGADEDTCFISQKSSFEIHDCDNVAIVEGAACDRMPGVLAKKGDLCNIYAASRSFLMTLTLLATCRLIRRMVTRTLYRPLTAIARHHALLGRILIMNGGLYDSKGELLYLGDKTSPIGLQYRTLTWECSLFKILDEQLETYDKTVAEEFARGTSI